MELREIITTDSQSTEVAQSTQALIASINEETYAIPLSSVLTIERVAVADICSVDQEAVIHLRDMIIPLVYLNKIFNIEAASTDDTTITVVVCMHEDAYFGIVVDRLIGQKDIEAKSLGVLDNSEFFSGASILDDDLALILNVESFVA